MKSNLLFLVLALSAAGTTLAQQAAPTLPPGHSTPPPTPTGTGTNAITPGEWQALRTARAAAIQANPDLLSENKKLIERMRAFEDKLDAVMIKADPTVAPILAKFEANRPHPGTSPAPVAVGTPPAK